jgi:hypothetical protein
VTIDYAKLARGIQAQGERKRNAPPSIEVEPLEQNFEATFRVGRGTFRLLHELQEIDPALWARQFASSVPEGAQVTSVRQGKFDVFTWRVIVTVITPA